MPEGIPDHLPVRNPLRIPLSLLSIPFDKSTIPSLGLTATIFRAQLSPVKQKLLVELARGKKELHLVEGREVLISCSNPSEPAT